MSAAIEIHGAAEAAEKIGKLTDAYLRLLAVPGDQQTIRAAMAHLAATMGPGVTSISNCHFTTAAEPATAPTAGFWPDRYPDDDDLKSPGEEPDDA